MIKLYLVVSVLAIGHLVVGQSSKPAKEDVEPPRAQDKPQRLDSSAVAGMIMDTQNRPGERKPKPERIDEDAEESVPVARRPKNRRPSSPQYYDDYEDDENCDNPADYMPDYSGIMRIASEPMRHFGRMMGDMFQNMPTFRGGPGGPPGSMVASSSAFVSGQGDDDYSQVSSQVRSADGRLQGIVSETRNGRTKTRRFGQQDEQDFDRN